jgi:hypothetical protein
MATRRITIDLSEEDYQRLIAATRRHNEHFPADDAEPQNVAYGLLAVQLLKEEIKEVTECPR